MGIRDVTHHRWGDAVVNGVRRLNDRHPWSHNEAFHPWVLTRVPDGARSALDVGCGRGELLAVLAEHVEQVRGIDVDAGMRDAARRRCAGLTNVTVDEGPLGAVAGPVDVVTMVAVLHHLDVEEALGQVRALLAPGGRFLCVGLAPPASVADHAWEVASMVANPVIGYVRHPWVNRRRVEHEPYPVATPTMTVGELREVLDRVMPGALLRHRLGFRHTVEWTRPA